MSPNLEHSKIKPNGVSVCDSDATVARMDKSIMLSSELTVLVTSSPVASNPATAMLEHVFGTFVKVPGESTTPFALFTAHTMLTIN